MDKEEILQFEEDDASRIGINGKQVFFTKRINGKTTHNKTPDEDKKNDDKEDLFLEFKNITYKEETLPSQKNINEKEQPKKKKISKREKKRRKRKKIAKFVLLVIIIIAITIIALMSPIFNIINIEIEGNQKIDSATIESLSQVHEGDNIFRISKNGITKNIKENAYIDSVSIKRKLPSTLQLTVKEREIAYQVKVINSYVYLDYQGYILEVASSGGKVPQIIGFKTDQDTLLNGKRLSNADITSSINTLAKIMETAKSAEIWDLISTITIKDNEYILKSNKENKTIYLGKATDLTNMMMYVKAIIKEEKGNTGEIFVNGDLNNGFKPYFRETKKQEEEKNE